MLLTSKAITLCLLIAFSIHFIMPFGSFARELIPGLNKARLSNGLTAIVKENHRAPVVAIQVWVQAGSVYETEGEKGITHLIEHMIFKGTEKRGPGEVAKEIESVGGSINAYTSLDYTVYHCVVPKQFLNNALDVLSDAVFHSSFDPEELEREKKVVLEEIRMRDDRPKTRLSSLLMETAYKAHPYGLPVIGYPETVKSFGRKDILAYMERRYRPSQITVVVVGDVGASHALAGIQETFGSVTKKEPQEFTYPSEPRQDVPRIAMEAMEIQEGYLTVAFSGLPNFNDPDVPILDVLAALLGKGESSYLTSSLRNRLQLVHSIDAAAFTPAGPGIFVITASLDPERTQEALPQIFHEIFRLENEGILDEELERAKVQVETDFVYSQETMEGEARKLGVFETLSKNPHAEKLYLEKVREVTAQDVQQIAGQIFRQENISVVMVMPEDRLPELTSQELAVMVQEAELLAKGIESDSGNLIHPVKRFSLSNGLTVLVQEASEVPTVAATLVFPGGVRYESEKSNGLFNFLAKAWTKGTEAHSAQGIAEIIEGLGSSISGFSGQNTLGLQGRFLSQNLDKGLALFTEILLTPTFPSEEIKKLRPLILAELKRQDDYLPGVAVREFRRLLFSPHPYGMNPLGKASVIKAINSKNLFETYRYFVIPDRGVLSIVGDIRAEEIISSIETMLGAWSVESEISLSTPPEPDPLISRKILNLKKKKQQVHIVLGFPGATFNSTERYALETMNAVLSGQGGRLFIDLRDKKSLAYSVTSFLGLGLDYGSFAFYIACAPEKKDRAVKGLWQEIYRVIREPVTDNEIERAKKWLIGTHEISLQTNRAKAVDMALNELYGLGYNFSSEYVLKIDEVTADQVLNVAKKFMNSEEYVLVRVGP
ncbi:MAG: insulinase family protein [Deltaproteobacteria bacterium]|nr:insulinase family protein [Deltaproteobacteria bacterium]MBW1931884.1 insulinase family protein [Deltaproteobacteria bacterium]MBW1937538.1 insulinase family protein [Deltaproteobacteria bacterium]MBW1964114.1 insulinase family protein [Deltaproteobacteria bacterium]